MSTSVASVRRFDSGSLFMSSTVFSSTGNGILLENGYAKPYDKVYCEKLPIYQAISLKAKSRKRGLFKELSAF